jgi:hypothetical protein
MPFREVQDDGTSWWMGVWVKPNFRQSHRYNLTDMIG